MANKAVIPLLVGMMLLTGVCNTLLTKYQDMQCVRNCDSSDPQVRHNFEQPVWQTAQMFVGEMGCWLVVAVSAIYRRMTRSSEEAEYEPIGSHSHRTIDGTTSDDEELQPGVAPAAKPLDVTDVHRKALTGWKVILLALPATCDIMGTTLMNVGLLFVAASIYQMTRGALVLFVGLFSVIMLRRHLPAYKWLALFIVVFGVAIVGLAGIIDPNPPTLPGTTDPSSPSPSSHTTTLSAQATHDLAHRVVRNTKQLLARALETTSTSTPLRTLIGILLIALAQIFTATQFVLEESLLHTYSLAPLQVVGYEGLFGLTLTLFFQLLAHLFYGSTPSGRHSYFDASSGWHQMTTHTSIAVSSALIMVSIGGFNYFGLSVTSSVSATSRSTIDTCRTLFIWGISLALGWEGFRWLQVLGFAGLVYGTFLFNDIVGLPRWVGGWWRGGRGGKGELLEETPVEHT